MDGYLSFRFMHKRAQNGGTAGTCAGSGRFAGGAFPDADLDIFAVDDFYEYDIGTVGL
jgi:hypothetical protein